MVPASRDRPSTTRSNSPAGSPGMLSSGRMPGVRWPRRLVLSTSRRITSASASGRVGVSSIPRGRRSGCQRSRNAICDAGGVTAGRSRPAQTTGRASIAASGAATTPATAVTAPRGRQRLSSSPDTGHDQCRHDPDRQVRGGGRGAVAMDTGQAEGEVDRGTQPVEEQRVAVAAVVDERSAIVADQGEGDRRRHHREDADDPAADRPLNPPGRQRQPQQRQHGHGEPRRGAVAAPPHRIDRHRTQIGTEHGGELHGEPRAPAGQRRQPDEAGQQHRRVDGESELLVAQQADDAGRDELEAAFGTSPIGRGGAGRAVDPPEVREPAGGRDQRRQP